MSQHIHLFGYVCLGGSPSQTPLVRESLEFNVRVITSLPVDSFWTAEEFRFVRSEDLRTLQMISVARFTTLRDHETILADFLAVLARMHWSDGYLVNQSLDRSLIGDPFRYGRSRQIRARGEHVGVNAERLRRGAEGAG